MADIYVKSGGGTKNAGDYRGIWTTAGNWAVGDRVIAVNLVSYRVHECTTAGAGDAAEPTWNTTTAGTTTMAAGAVFTTRIPDTWANATVDLTRAAANDAAGDTIYVSQSHNESTASTVTLNLAGTNTSPTRIICANDSATPPTSVATTGTVTATTSGGIVINGSVYVYGLNFSANAAIQLGTAGSINQYFEKSSFYITVNSSNINVMTCNVAAISTSKTVFNQCTFRFTNAGCGIQPAAAKTIVLGGGLHSSSVAITALCPGWGGGRAQGDVLIDGFDCSTAASTMKMLGGTAGNGPNTFIIRNSELPASWTGTLFNGTPTGPGSEIRMYNCDSADTNYRLRTESISCTVVSETTIVRTGGASDGATPLSWKMVSTSNANYPSVVAESPEIVIWNDTTASAKTITVEVVTDNVTLTDAECWLEVQYLGTSGFPLGVFLTDCKADVLATAANQTTSAVAWTTTGLTTPVKQKLEVTFTPQEKGFVHAKVMLAKPSTIVYVCPKATVA